MTILTRYVQQTKNKCMTFIVIAMLTQILATVDDYFRENWQAPGG